mgnify:CR=1 FL=1
MQKMKKFLAVLTAGVLCAGALPVMQVNLPQMSITASAETADGLSYQLINMTERCSGFFYRPRL